MSVKFTVVIETVDDVVISQISRLKEALEEYFQRRDIDAEVTWVIREDGRS